MQQGQSPRVRGVAKQSRSSGARGRSPCAWGAELGAAVLTSGRSPRAGLLILGLRSQLNVRVDPRFCGVTHKQGCSATRPQVDPRFCGLARKLLKKGGVYTCLASVPR